MSGAACVAPNEQNYTNLENTMNTQDIEAAVNSIEQDIVESTGGVEYLNITLQTNGCVQIVEFAGIRIWDSESDDRKYVDEFDEDSREPIEAHLRRALREELEKLARIVV